MSRVWKMPIYNHKLLHIHIPKTGGTTITENLKDRGVNIQFYDKGSKKEYGNVPPQHMTISYTEKFMTILFQIQTLLRVAPISTLVLALGLEQIKMVTHL